MSPSFHQLLAQRAFPSNPPALLFQISSEKSINRRQCENPPLFACQPVCLFSLAAINNWEPRCNEMVMLVRTIPRPASAFRPPVLPGDNNFSTPRLEHACPPSVTPSGHPRTGAGGRKRRGDADTCAAKVAFQTPVQLAIFFSSHLGPLASSNNAPSFCSSIHALLPRRRLRWPGMQQHQA